MTGVPWHVKGVHPEARETARVAARRSGLSVGKWLNSVILDSADRDEELDAPQDRRQPRGLEIAALNARFDSLTRQIDRLLRSEARDRWDPPRTGAPGDTAGQPIADAVVRLEAKLDQLLVDRTSAGELGRRAGDIDRALASLGQGRLGGAYIGGEAGDFDRAIAEISARQRSLDMDSPVSAQAPTRGVASAAGGPDFGKLEHCLREITDRLEALQSPCRAADLTETLRNELAEMRRTVAEAMPRGAIEAIESQLRAVGARLDAQRETGIDPSALSGFERGLADIREALRRLSPVESLNGLDEALERLSQKMDLVAGRGQDPDSLRQLEAGIDGLRGVVAHIASADALSALAGDVRALGERLDRTQRADPGLMERLEARIAAIGEAIEARRAPAGAAERAEVDDLVRSIAGKLEGLQLTRADQSALMHLEERMAQLAAKLDASEARLGHLDAIERGVGELLVHLQEPRPAAEPAAAVADMAAIEALTRDIAALRQSRSDTDQRTQDLLDAMHGTIAQVAERLATIETDLRSPARTEAPPVSAARSFAAPLAAAPSASPPFTPPASAPASPSLAAPTGPLALQAAPVERLAKPTVEAPAARGGVALPPDTPLEPGTGAPRSSTVASAMERIAASEAAVAATNPATEQRTAKSSFIIAARRAAQAAASEHQDKGRVSAASATSAEQPDAKPPGKLVQRMKSLIGGASVVLIVTTAALGVGLYLGLPTRLADKSPVSHAEETRAAPRPSLARNKDKATAPARAPQASIESAPEASPTIATIPSPVTATPASPAPAIAETTPQAKPEPEPDPAPTGALPRDPLPAGSARLSATPPAPPTDLPVPDPLPPTIGGRTLLAAAAAGDPAAAYEVGARFAEGRGVTQDSAAAASWFARAAAAGLAPAQFRLGSMYEKGIGVAKDLAEAHRLYVAAAAKGNAKAMHNLAVLNAEGFQGKPDYAAAAQWFQKAAGYGVTDSQYNLGILYARGIGVEQNLAESYKWFALAARGGDPESAKKRDDVGSRLDQQSLLAARLAAQTYVAESQPEEAIAVKAPPGGWDEAKGPAKPKSRTRPRAG